MTASFSIMLSATRSEYSHTQDQPISDRYLLFILEVVAEFFFSPCLKKARTRMCSHLILCTCMILMHVSRHCSISCITDQKVKLLPYLLQRSPAILSTALESRQTFSFVYTPRFYTSCKDTYPCSLYQILYSRSDMNR